MFHETNPAKMIILGVFWLIFQCFFLRAMVQLHQFQRTLAISVRIPSLLSVTAFILNLNVTERTLQLMFEGKYSLCWGMVLLTHLNFPALVWPYVLRGMICYYHANEIKRRQLWWLFSYRWRVTIMSLGIGCEIFLFFVNERVLTEEKYRWSETLDGPRNCFPNRVHVTVTFGYIFLGICASLTMWHLLKRAPQDAFGIIKELRLFCLVLTSLYVSSFIWVIVQEKFNMQFSFVAYAVILGNLILFHASFLRPFRLRNYLVTPVHLTRPQKEIDDEEFQWTAGNIDSVLSNPQKFEKLLEICKRHFVEELPRFLLRVYEYKNETHSTIQEQYDEYVAIVNDFIAQTSPYEINVSHDMRQDIFSIRSYGHFCTADRVMRRQIFNTCEVEVRDLLASNFAVK